MTDDKMKAIHQVFHDAYAATDSKVEGLREVMKRRREPQKGKSHE